MRRSLPVWALSACLLLAGSPAWCEARISLGLGASWHMAPHPAYDEPEPAPSGLLGELEAEVAVEDTAAALTFSAGWVSGAVDWELALGFRRRIALEWAGFSPYIEAGGGWAARTSPAVRGLERGAVFPQAGLGVETRSGALALRLGVLYRPAPFPLPLGDIEEVALRRVALFLRAYWSLCGARPGRAAAGGD